MPESIEADRLSGLSRSDLVLWLQAADRHIVIYVGFTSNFGSLDAEFPLLEALRTKPGVPRPAAFDPKPKSASEP